MIKSLNYILIIGFLIPGLSFSDLALAESEGITSDGLYLSPNLCLLSQKEEDCQIKIEARWKTPRKGEYCLMSNTQSTPLFCWDNNSSGRHTFSLKIKSSTIISLVDKQTQTLIYRHKVRLQRQVTRFRKKRRNPWQFY